MPARVDGRAIGYRMLIEVVQELLQSVRDRDLYVSTLSSEDAWVGKLFNLEIGSE